MQAVIDKYRCRESIDGCSDKWCAKHTRQHRVSHNFYKYVESEWDRVCDDALCNSDNIESKKDGLRFLSIALVAREAHTDWFYSGQPCDGHKERERMLRAYRNSVKRETYALKHGIIDKMTAPILREIIRDRISQIAVVTVLEATTEENHAASQELGKKNTISTDPSSQTIS